MRSRILVGTLAAAAATLTFAPEATAQVFTPTYLPPGLGSETGVAVSTGPGDLGAEVFFRRTFGGFDLGLRGGIADIADEVTLLIGGDYRNPIDVLDGQGPLRLDVTGGAQAMIGDFDAFGVQAGLSVGADLPSEGLVFTPYVHPRLALINGPGEDDTELELLADIGLMVDTGRLSLHAGFTINNELPGDDEVFGFGISWR